jgi:competence transcription factor ComK
LQTMHSITINPFRLACNFRISVILLRSCRMT